MKSYLVPSIISPEGIELPTTSLSSPARTIAHRRRVVIELVRFQIHVSSTTREQLQSPARTAIMLVQTNTPAVCVYRGRFVVEVSRNSLAAISFHFNMATTIIRVTVEIDFPAVNGGEQRAEEDEGDDGQKESGRTH